MTGNVTIRLLIAMALVIAGAQFTHAGEIHEGLGHFGHHDGHHDHTSAVIGHGEVEITSGNDGSESASSTGGLHCGAPLMAVFGQDIFPPCTTLTARPAAPSDALLTVRHGLDPPPPRA